MIFQISNRVCGNIVEIKPYFSDKYHLYRLKQKFSIIFDRTEIHFNEYILELVADIFIFQRRLGLASIASKKF